MKITPPKSAQRRAARALEIRADLPPSRRAGLSPGRARALGIRSGVSQARRIARGAPVEVAPVRAFFSRFAGMVERARAQGLDARTSRAVLAWDLWGGDPMARAVFSSRFD